MVFVYAFLWLIMQVLYLQGIHSTSGLGPARYIILCVPFYFFGNNISFDNGNVIKGIVFSYVFAHIVFTTLAFFLLFWTGVSNAKNMSGQVLGLGIVLDFSFVPRLIKSRIGRIFIYSWGVFSLITLWFLHSRTPFIAALIVIFFFFFERKRNPIAYFFVILLVIVVIVYFGQTQSGNEQLQNFLIGNRKYTEVDFSNADAIFSGRFEIFAEAISDFFSHPLVGVGGWAYIDNFPLHVLRVGGLTYGILILPFVYKRLFGCIFGFRKRKCNMKEESNEFLILLSAKYISLFFIVVSLMEGYPPLGPGTSAFFLWIVLGMKDAVTEKEQI